MASVASQADTALYGYVPTKWVGILAVILFAVSTLLHCGQAIRYKTWYMFPTVILCGLLEILGWVCRTLNSYSPTEQGPWKIQIVATVIAPTPLIAADFMILGQIIYKLGEQYSRISSRLYSRIFLTIDIICLIVQALGGGRAAEATTVDGAEKGADILLGGIVFQLASLIIYMSLGTEFFFSRKNNRPVRPSITTGQTRKVVNSNEKIMSFGVALMTIFLLTRQIYRTIELADGWYGYILRTEVYFDTLDMMMIAFAMLALNVFHPGHFLADRGDDMIDANGSLIPMEKRV